MNDICTKYFSDFGIIITGKTPSSSFPDDFGDEYPFVTPTDSFNHKYIQNTHRYLSSDGLEKLKGKAVPRDSLMVTCIGSAMGKVAMTAATSITNQQINTIVISDEFDSHYLYYCFKNNYKLLRNAASGSTALPLLNKTEFEKLKCTVHSNKETQNRIANVLSRLDKKIELNNKINAELEAMAKLIYDYWFVQFDFPDANGKPYKSSGGKMVYNETLKREIPDGWEGAKVGDILSSELGGTPSTKVRKYWAGDIPWLNSGEISNFPIMHAQEHITDNAIDNSATSLMPKGTCVLSITRHLRPSILAVDACANQSVVGIYESEKFKSSYLYPYLKNEIPRLMSLRTGAQQPHINKGIVDASPIVSPPSKTLKNYYTKVNNVYEQINNFAFQNKELIGLRDWLLPMLMNGQVTVNNSSSSA